MSAALDESNAFFWLRKENPPKRSSDNVRFELLIPSLRHLAGVGVALTLWIRKWSDIRLNDFSDQSILRSEYDIRAMICSLDLPDSSIEMISWYSFQIGIQSKDFNRHFSSLSKGGEVFWLDFEAIEWTSRGNVDMIRTIYDVTDEDKEILFYDHLISDYDMEDQIFNEPYWYEDHCSDVSMNPRLFFNRHHSWMCDFWTCRNSVGQKRIISACLNDMINGRFCRIHDVCLLLVYCSPELVKHVIIFHGPELLKFFLNKPFHEDYFLQTATLIRNIVVDFDFKEISMEIMKARSKWRRKASTSAFKAFALFCHNFSVFLANNSTAVSNVTCFYSLLLRREVDIEMLACVVSRMDEVELKQTIGCLDLDICSHLLCDGRLDYLKTYVQLYKDYNDESEIAEAKKNLVHDYGAEIALRYFDTKNLPELISFFEWISDDDTEKALEFKEYVTLKCLYRFIWKEHRPFLQTDEFKHHRADSFLNWFWSCDVEKIGYVKEDFVEELLPLKKFPGAECISKFVDEVISWLFNQDRDKIELFKNESHCKRLYSLIQ